MPRTENRDSTYRKAKGSTFSFSPKSPEKWSLLHPAGFSPDNIHCLPDESRTRNDQRDFPRWDPHRPRTLEPPLKAFASTPGMTAIFYTED
jgi:hypothetical protein